MRPDRQYPTLAELAGLPKPTGPGTEHLGGTSLAPIFETPFVDTYDADGRVTSREYTAVKDVTLSQFPRCWQNNTGHDGNQYHSPGDERNHTNSLYSMSDCHWVRRDAMDFMGYSLRTDTHRFIEWFKWDGQALMPLWDQVVGRELYDHSDHAANLTCQI